jgi:uncharacterized protein with HEPN domain
MRSDDAIRIRHMLDAARDARAFSAGKSRADPDRDRQLALVLIKCIEIVGEAASRVREETRAECPAIPWQDIVAMRNRLIHAYYDVDLNFVWDTISIDLPPLIEDLERILRAREQ